MTLIEIIVFISAFGLAMASLLYILIYANDKQR